MKGRLLTASCTTGWLDWIHGELWLFPDGLLRIRTSFGKTLAHGTGPTVPSDVVLVREFSEDERQRLAAEHKTNLWARADEVRTASLHRGLTTDRLRLSLADGRSVKLLMSKSDDAYQPLQAALGRWGIRADWVSISEPARPEVPVGSLSRRRLSLRTRVLLVAGTVVSSVAALAAGIYGFVESRSGPVGPRIVAAAAPPSRLIGIGRPGLYFIADGPVPRGELKALVSHFGSRFHVHTELLPPIQPSTRVVDYHRHQLVAEKAIDEMTAVIRAPRELHVAVLGITPYDAYTQDNPSWHFTFGLRWKRGNQGAALISNARMALGADASKRRRRLRTMIARYIGEAYFGLPRNDDRRSALYKSIRGNPDLDGMSEELCPSEPGVIKSC